MTKKIALIGGDGIGPEVIHASKNVLESLLPGEFSYHEISAGYDHFLKTGETISSAGINLCRSVDAVLYGANTNPPEVENYKSLTLTLRKELGLFANVRPALSLPKVAKYENVNLTVVRENSEGLYIRDEEDIDGGAVAKRKITSAASHRIIQYALELAVSTGKKRVTLVHKANVLKKTCGLFRNIGLTLAKEYPSLTVDERFVDAMAMELVLRPEEFEVLVTTNLFGDILSDEASALVGGMGVAPGANIGEGTAVFEPVHGSAPDIAGKGIANPLAAILSAKMMIEHLGYTAEAKKLEAAIHITLEEGQGTPDIGGTLSTQQYAETITERLSA